MQTKRAAVRILLIVVAAVFVSTAGLWLPRGQRLNPHVAYAGENIWTWAGVAGDAHKMVSHQFDPSTIYAFVDPAGLRRSDDGGGTWSLVDAPGSPDAGISHIALAPSAPGVLYATADGVYRSEDKGSTWIRVSSISGEVTVSPVDWREAYLAYGATLLKTTDGGETWEDLSDRLHSSCKPMNGALAIAHSAPHIAVTRGGNRGTIPCKTTDGGSNWVPLTTAPNGMQQTVVFDPTNSQIMYMGTTLPGGWKTTDGGETWVPLAGGLGPNGWQFVVNPDNTQIIYAANGERGVVESSDGGVSWVTMDTGIQGLYVRTIALGGRNPLKLYAGTYGAGIWELTRTGLGSYGVTINDGALFTNQTAVTLTLTAPPATTEMMISNDGGFGEAVWELYAKTRAWTITDYGGYVLPRIVYVKFKTSGQISGQYQDDIVLDQIAPTGTVQITETFTSMTLGLSPHVRPATDALTATTYLPFIGRNHRPGLQLVGLALSATDNLSGVSDMLIGSDSTFAGHQWEAYRSQVNRWVPDTQTSMVYVKFRDRAGNESPAYSAAIEPH